MDILIVGNWIHPTANTLEGDLETNGKENVRLLMESFKDAEKKWKFRFFPPLEYSWYFSQKVYYYTHLFSMNLPKNVHLIPTLALVSSPGRSWKKQIKDFATNTKSSIIFKRELSEISQHTVFMSSDSLDMKLLPGLDVIGGFQWMAQPVISVFRAPRISNVCYWW